MQVLDLFNTRYERELQEGAVDDLESRRIDLLNDRMQDLLARARESNYKNNPAALASLKTQFQQVKDERDSYYKVREGRVTPTATGIRHHAKPGNYGGYEPERELKGLNKTLTKNLEKGMGIEFKKGGVGNRIQPDVDEAGIPGNVPVEKIPGKEDLLKGKGRSYYEEQSVSEISDQTVQNYKEKAWDEFAQGKDRRGAGIGRALDKQRGALGHVKTTDQKKSSEVAEADWNDEDDYEDEDLRLRSGDYVRDQQDGEYGEVFRMQGDPEERRVRILDRDGKGWYIEPSRLTRVDPTDPDVQRYFGKQRVRDMDESDMADQVKKVFKDKAGKPVGEIGIDPESSPGNGEWYVHHYATGYSVVGFDSAAEAKRELMYVNKHPDAVEGHPSTKEQGVAESAKPGEYYIHTVYFKDGTKKRVRVTSDEFDVVDYYTKRGQAVDHVDYDFQLHSDMTEGVPQELINRYLAIDAQNDVEAVQAAIQSISRDPSLSPGSKSRLLGQIGMIINRHRLPIGRAYYTFMQQFMEAKATKTRLDPKCWTGKKIGNPKTKVKGGVRVNNCVPAESVEEGLKSTLAGAALAGAMALGGAGAAQAQSAAGGPNVVNATTIIQQIQSGKIQNQNDLASALGNASNKQAVFKILQNKAGLPGHGADSVINALGKKNATGAQQPAAGAQPTVKSAGQSGSIIQKPIDNFESKIKEDNDSEAVERAILNRIMVAHTDLLKQFGPQKVMQAAEEVAYNVGDVDEIGTSDVSAYVAQVKQILGVPREVNEKWSQKYKSSINCASPKGFSQKAHCAGKKK